MLTNSILNIEHSKLIKKLGWKADENFDSGIFKTIEWYLEKYNKEDNQ